MRFSQYIAYFKTVATNHKLLAHVDKTHHTFYQIDIEDILNGLAMKNKDLSILIECPETKTQDEKSDNIRKLKQGAFLILKEAINDNMADREAILDLTEEVAEDVVSKLMNDTRKSRLPGAMQPKINVDANSIRIQKVGPILTNHFGWRVEFTLNSTFSNGLQLDVTKWNSETKYT